MFLSPFATAALSCHSGGNLVSLGLEHFARSSNRRMAWFSDRPTSRTILALSGGCQLIKQIGLVITIVTIGMVPAPLSQAQLNRLGPPDIYPDATRTPGAANPQITQGNIKDTICSRHWSTKLVRPPAGYTSKLKRRQLREYGRPLIYSVAIRRAQEYEGNMLTGKEV